MSNARPKHRSALTAAVLAAALAAALALPAAASAAECTITSSAEVIVGTSRSDVICVTGGGTHVVYGGLLDDEIYGGDGDDLLIGGHGTDLLHGRLGDDVLRGGTGRDCYIGGAGDDTVSFASMTPDGDSTTAGVVADLTEEEADPTEGPPPTCDGGGFAGEGRANGEGYLEELVGIENLVGSAFDDDLEAANGGTNEIYGGWGDDVLRGRSNGGPKDDMLRGEAGDDTCRNAGSVVECDDGPEGSHRPSGAFAASEDRGLDQGVVVLGAEGWADDQLAVTRYFADHVRVRGTPLTPTARCARVEANEVLCDAPHPRYVVVWGDGGNDALSIGPNFPNEASLDLNGGPGNDTLAGDSGPEILFSGEGGVDDLEGGAGTDALLSEGDPVGSGGDRLAGGDGNDQLVTDNSCAGHLFLPGSDTGTGASGDIVGFARQTNLNIPGGGPRGVHAQLGEGSNTEEWRQAWAIPKPAGCANSTIAGGGEILEGTNQGDVLYGNRAPNEIWGRDGLDEIYGLEGSDILHGHAHADKVYGNTGNDTVWGEDGADELRGGDGADKLRALDNNQDTVVNCGGDADYPAQADPNDPVFSCGELR